MLADLKPLDRLRAEALLAAVREKGSLSAGADAVGLSFRQALRRWKQWGLGTDHKLRRGRRSKSDKNVAPDE